MITSRHHPQIKSIRKLLTRKGREDTNTFIAEGIRQVATLFDTPYLVHSLVIAPDLLKSRLAWDLVTRHRTNGGTCLAVSPDAFTSISVRDNPQGLAAIAHGRITTIDLFDETGPALWVALLDTQDPGNLGTIARTCDAVGGAGIILLGDGVDPYHPTAIRASTGAMFTVRIARSGIDELIDWANTNRLELVGTSDAAELDFRDQSIVSGRGRVLVMGGERQGIPSEMVSRLDRVIRIPMMGMCDSLNLAVATSIILYEFAHRRSEPVHFEPIA